MGRKAVESNAVFIDDLHVPADDLVGEEGRGFYYLLEGLNPERVLIGAEAVGLGRAALSWAAGYAKERVVFGRPIGQNQGVTHLLAKAWAELKAANLMAFKAAALHDAGASAAPRPMRPSSWAGRRASRPARRQCWRTAAWATPRSSTWSATSANP